MSDSATNAEHAARAKPGTSTTAAEVLRGERSLYSTQFTLGFRSLTFMPELENVFREHYVRNSPGRLKQALPIALVLTVLFSLSDYMRVDSERLGDRLGDSQVRRNRCVTGVVTASADLPPDDVAAILGDERDRIRQPDRATLAHTGQPPERVG